MDILPSCYQDRKSNRGLIRLEDQISLLLQLIFFAAVFHNIPVKTVGSRKVSAKISVSVLRFWDESSENKLEFNSAIISSKSVLSKSHRLRLTSLILVKIEGSRLLSAKDSRSRDEEDDISISAIRTAAKIHAEQKKAGNFMMNVRHALDF